MKSHAPGRLRDLHLGAHPLDSLFLVIISLLRAVLLEAGGREEGKGRGIDFQWGLGISRNRVLLGTFRVSGPLRFSKACIQDPDQSASPASHKAMCGIDGVRLEGLGPDEGVDCNGLRNARKEEV